MAAGQRQTSFLIGNYDREAVRFVRGEGCYLFDEEGRRYLDAFAGVAVSVLGHGHPRLSARIADQAAQLIHTSNHYGASLQEELAERLVHLSFPGRVLFCNSGAEANEAAYKLARLYGNVQHEGKKHRMLAFENGFHGRTLASLSITANPAYRQPFGPLPPAEFLPYGDAAALETAMGDDVVAVFCEVIQGEGGIHVPPPDFFPRLRAACDAHGALLVCDEIQTGIGRTGTFFAYQHEGIEPDILTLAKALGGGMPIGAVVAKEAVASLLKPGLHGTTFGGNPLACAAALTVLDEVERPGFIVDVAARGQAIAAGLRSLFGPTHEVRGRGLLLGVQLQEAPKPFVRAARAAGVLVGPASHQTVRIAPPLILTDEQVDELLEGLAVAWQSQTSKGSS